MRVAIVSSFRDGYEVALEACYARAFELLGARVHRIRLDGLEPSPRGPLGLATARLAVRASQRKILNLVLDVRPDVAVLVKAAYVTSSTVRAWRASGVRVANVFPDNPFDAAGATGLGGALLGQLAACDAVFVHDRLVVGQLRSYSVRSLFIPFARDPSLHAPALRGGGLDDSPRLAFVGNPDPERIRFLRAVCDLGLGLWGRWSWAKLSTEDPLARCVRGEEQMGVEMVRCLGSAQLSINVLRSSQKTAHNMRTFESPACGTCTLSEASNGVLELMEDGVEVVTFTTPAELRATAQALLADAPRRESIARAGWARVEGETYEARAKQVLESIC